MKYHVSVACAIEVDLEASSDKDAERLAEQTALKIADQITIGDVKFDYYLYDEEFNRI